MSGIHNSAIVLLALGPERAEAVLRCMGEDVAWQVRRHMRLAARESGEVRGEAIRAFLAQLDGTVERELENAIEARESDDDTGGESSDDIPDEDNELLLDSIRDEHPQTIALVLSHLRPGKAGEILAALPAEKQVEIVKAIAGIEQTSSEVIEEVERGLRQRLGRIINRTVRGGGVSAVAEILNAADRRAGREILDSLEHDSPDLAEQIRRVQSIFEDLLHARDQDIRLVLDQLDVMTISLALRTARERLVRKVLLNLADEDAERIESERQSAEPVRISDIEAAQRRVAEVVERLNRTGEIQVYGPRRRRPKAAGGKV